MAHTDERYVDFLTFCEALLSKKFKVGWFSGVTDKDDLIQDLYIHFSQRGIQKPSPGLILKVAKDKLIDAMRRERRQRPLPEPESIQSRLRRLTSTLNAREEFELFAQTLTPSEILLFEFLKAHHRYGTAEPGRGPSEPDMTVGARFMEDPKASIIGEIASFLGISKNAASQRLSRLRTKYFLFREEITGDDGKRLTYVGYATKKAKKNRQCDELGWLSTDAAAPLLGMTEDELVSCCRQGKVDAHRANPEQWFVDPQEITRYLKDGPRPTRSFKRAMAALARQPESKCMRRAVWASERGLRLIEGSPPCSQTFIQLPAPAIVADCFYQTRTRDSGYTWTPYIPSEDDRTADDWVRYYTDK